MKTAEELRKLLLEENELLKSILSKSAISKEVLGKLSDIQSRKRSLLEALKKNLPETPSLETLKEIRSLAAANRKLVTQLVRQITFSALLFLPGTSF